MRIPTTTRSTRPEQRGFRFERPRAWRFEPACCVLSVSQVSGGRVLPGLGCQQHGVHADYGRVGLGEPLGFAGRDVHRDRRGRGAQRARALHRGAR
jgi:hypothetical protein